MNGPLTIRRLLLVAAIASVCFCILGIPSPAATATVIDATVTDATVVEPQRTVLEVIHGALYSWPVRLLAYVGSVVLLIHTMGQSVGLTGLALWAFAVVVPCVGELMWYYFVVVRQPLHRDTLGILGHAQLGLIVQTIAYSMLPRSP